MRLSALAALAGVCLAAGAVRAWPEARCVESSTLAGRVPNEGPDGFEEVELPGTASTGLVALPTGGFALGISGPSGVAFLDARGEPVGVARTSSIVDRPLLVSDEGRVFAASATQLCVVARDATARGCARVIFGSTHRPARLPGSGVATLFDSQHVEPTVTLFDAEGSPRGAVSVPRERDARVSALVVTRGGEAVFAMGALLVFVAPDLSVRRVYADGDVRALAASRDGLAYATDDALVVADARGRSLHRVEVATSPNAIVALDQGRIATLTRAASVQVTVFSSRLDRLGSIAVPGRDAVDVRGGDDGALLVTSDEGVIARLDPDGTTRWRVEVPHGRLRPPALALRGGGLIVATTGPRLLRLRRRGPHGDAH